MATTFTVTQSYPDVDTTAGGATAILPIAGDPTERIIISVERAAPGSSPSGKNAKGDPAVSDPAVGSPSVFERATRHPATGDCAEDVRRADQPHASDPDIGEPPVAGDPARNTPCSAPHIAASAVVRGPAAASSPVLDWPATRQLIDSQPAAGATAVNATCAAGGPSSAREHSCVARATDHVDANPQTKTTSSAPH